MASTNGSWLRLSKESVSSEDYRLEKDLIFKIGSSAIYQIDQFIYY